MNCTDLEKMARVGELESRRQDVDVVEHLRGCDGCQALYGGDSPLGELLCDAPDLRFEGQFDELSRAVRAEDSTMTGRLRALPSTQRYGILIAFGLVLTLLTFLIWRRPDYDTYLAARMQLVVLTLMVVALLTVPESLRPLSVRPAPMSRLALLAAGLGVPLALAVLPEAPHLHEANHGREPVWLGSLPCLGIGLGVAAPVALLWSRLQRGGNTPRLWMLVAALGGLFGNAVLQIHCPVTRSAHLVLGHASVGFTFAGFMLLLWRTGRLRSP